MQSSSLGNFLPSSIRAHLSTSVYNSFTVLGNRTFILERMRRLRTLDWKAAITAAGWIFGIFYGLYRIFVNTYGEFLLPSAREVAGRWACRALVATAEGTDELLAQVCP